MGLFSFLKGKHEQKVADLSPLKVDMHSHLVPGIDDGSIDLNNSLELVTGLHRLGYRKLITTPHVMADHYRNSTETIVKGTEALNAFLLKTGIDVQVHPAAEYYLDNEFLQRIKSNDLLSFGERYLLFELPFFSQPDILFQVIFDLQLAGYKPVLAHPERYAYWFKTPEKYEELNDRGVILQANLLSFAGVYGKEAQKTAEFLADRKLIKMLGSDCHNQSQVELLSSIRSEHLSTLLNSGLMLNPTL